MSDTLSAITYNPQLIEVTYPGDNTVYNNTACITFKRVGGVINRCQEATETEIQFLKQFHPEVFNHE